MGHPAGFLLASSFWFRKMSGITMRIPLLLTLCALMATQGQAGGRRGAEPTTPETAAEQRGRGAATNNAVIADIVDETPSITHHEITVGGRTLKYTATVAQMPIMSASGETEARIFYVAYT